MKLFILITIFNSWKICIKLAHGLGSADGSGILTSTVPNPFRQGCNENNAIASLAVIIPYFSLFSVVSDFPLEY